MCNQAWHLHMLPCSPAVLPAVMLSHSRCSLVWLPAGVNINTSTGGRAAGFCVDNALEVAVVECPPWAALMLLRQGASPGSCINDIASALLTVARRRSTSAELVQLLAALLQAGAPASANAVFRLAELACDSNAAHKSLVDDSLEAHVGHCQAMLNLLLQHGAPLPVREATAWHESCMQHVAGTHLGAAVRSRCIGCSITSACNPADQNLHYGAAGCRRAGQHAQCGAELVDRQQ